MHPFLAGHRRGVTLASLALVLYSFAFLGSRGLWDRDEGRYTHVALNMLDSGDWLTPRLDEQTPHFTKPPLTYWTVAASAGLLGRSEWAIRFPYAIAFILTVLGVYGIALRLTPDRPWLPPLIYATTPLAYAAAGIVTTDTLLACFETLAVLGFVRAWHAPTASRARTLAVLSMWLGFGLAFLTKGPPGLLPLAAIACFVAACRPGLGWRELLRPSGLVLFAGVSLSWYLVEIARTPGLLRYFLVDEVLNRVATTEHHRNGAWYGVFVVYLPTLLLLALPWSLPAAAAAVDGLRRRAPIWRIAVWRTHPQAAFLGLWFAVPLLIFCLARSRLPLYLLPLFVPLSLMVARRLDPAVSWLTRRPAPIVGLALLLVVARFLASIYPTEQDRRALAARLERTIGDRVEAVAFVDSPPGYGLGFYLHAPVHTVTLEAALANEAPGTLYVLNREHAVLLAERAHARGQTTFATDAAGGQIYLMAATRPVTGHSH